MLKWNEKIQGLKEKQLKKKKTEMKMKIWGGKEANKALSINVHYCGICSGKNIYVCDRKHKVEKFFHNMKNSGDRARHTRCRGGRMKLQTKNYRWTLRRNHN